MGLTSSRSATVSVARYQPELRPGSGPPRRAGGVGHPAPVHFVGIDLAWGENKPTGLAVLDDDGVLVHVCAVRSDEQIAQELAPYTAGDCLVAIDAPLIVRNATGNRPAEAELNRDFARFDAGAHPANTSKPELAGTPRGARVSALLGLDMNPKSRRRRRAIEVYPHPATVSLFRLGRTLKYKSKPGRDFATLRGELLVLIALVEGLAAAEPRLAVDAPGSRWPALRAAVEDATRKSELRAVEDQVDAVVCAYVGLLATREPKAMTVYGDFANGYIVTPTLPEGHRPSPRPKGAGATAGSAPAAVREYSDRHEELTKAGAAFVALVTSILDDAGINYLSVTGRTKSVASFAGKAARRQDGQLLHPDPLRDITDQIGVRVITYVLSDVSVVADLMGDQVVVRDDRDLGRETASQGRFGYASRHLVIALDAARESQPAYEPLRGLVASLQIRTVLQHAWAEFEHDIRYKGTVPAEHARDFDRRFTLAAGLLELADREFSTIRDRLRVEPAERSEPEDDDPRIEPRELAAFLAGQYADAGWSRTDHYAWISGLLLELAITSLDELGDVLRPIDELDLNARMDYRYPPGAVRRLDDALLAAFGRRYIELRGNEHRVPALRARLERLTGDAPS
jgi:predicted RNase H-like nuclease/ppGpp synthetase/RelA/SpoT-type nucleotidyltranferase